MLSNSGWKNSSLVKHQTFAVVKVLISLTPLIFSKLVLNSLQNCTQKGYHFELFE